MALQWESPWMEVYRAANKRRYGRVRRLLVRLTEGLREPIDALLFIGVIFGAALLLTWILPN
jgi:hypothetical protein